MSGLPASRVLFTHEEIAQAIAGLAEAVTERCKSDEWLAVCVMHGGLIFAGELLQQLPFRLKQDFVRVTRYHESVTVGDLQWVVYPESDLAGKHVLLIDDIFDEGYTLSMLAAEFLRRGAASVVCVVLLEKNHARKVDGYRPDFVGLTCEDEYVFGYGMDLEGYWRNLPEIRVLLTDGA